MKHTTHHMKHDLLRGFTIVEVMVALVITSILLLGVINIFVASKTTYTLQNGVARLQENARYAIQVMTRSIQMAGYNTNSVLAAPFTAAGSTDGGGNASDTIRVSYAAATDCLNTDTAGTGGIATDVFTVDATPSLTCNGTAIVDGVQNLQVLYGVDTTGGLSGGPDGIADSYVPAGSVPTWGNSSLTGGITSVRIALLINTADNVNTATDGNTYNLLDAPALGPFADQMVRRIYTQTILLRNYTNAR